jgi:16S rRNA (cytosine1402-N4)-methyltransferase
MMPKPLGTPPSPRHVPVLLQEVLEALEPRSGGVIVDGTFGAGGYTRALLEAADCQVLAIDQDPDVIVAANHMRQNFGNRLIVQQGKFSELDIIAHRAGITEADGVVLDVGVSSMQLDDADRGFSFQKDGPLDMRMSRQGLSAADIVNSMEAEELARILYTCGEEPRSRAIARAIVRARAVAPILTTMQLVKAITPATGPLRSHLRIHPATRTFQALRIFVNRELEELGGGLAAAERLLRCGGRLAVVTFHSLEDRLVKHFLAMRCGRVPAQSRHLPERSMQQEPSFVPLFKGHIEATEAEKSANPRARSAKLRAARRTAAPAIAMKDSL